MERKINFARYANQRHRRLMRINCWEAREKRFRNDAPVGFVCITSIRDRFSPYVVDKLTLRATFIAASKLYSARAIDERQ